MGEMDSCNGNLVARPDQTRRKGGEGRQSDVDVLRTRGIVARLVDEPTSGRRSVGRPAVGEWRTGEERRVGWRELAVGRHLTPASCVMFARVAQSVQRTCAVHGVRVAGSTRASSSKVGGVSGVGGNEVNAGGFPTAAALKAQKADSSALRQLKYFHHTGLVLAAAVPAALALSPSALNMPVDLVLSAAVPYHAYVGTVGVVEDYVPRDSQETAKTVALFVAGLMAAGMFKATFFGSGPTEAVKALWRDAPEKNADA